MSTNNNKPLIKQGAFSLHQKSSDIQRDMKLASSVDVNSQSFLTLQAQLKKLAKKTPYKSEENLKTQQPELVQMLEKAKNQKSKQQSQNRKLNFNHVADTLSNSNTNPDILSFISENIFKKDEYYEKIRQENQELKETINKKISIIAELKKKLNSHDTQLKQISQNLNTERANYQQELLKINEKIQTMKSLKITLQNEEKKNNQLQQDIKDSNTIIDILTNQIVDQTIQSISFLDTFKKVTFKFQGLSSLIKLLKHSTSLILQSVSKAQEFNLPQLKDYKLPEFDLKGFFDYLENLQQEEESLSFRQKNNSLSQVGKKQTISSKQFSIQDQFNTFLDQTIPSNDYKSNESPSFFEKVQRFSEHLEKAKQINLLPSKRDQQYSATNRMNSQQIEDYTGSDTESIQCDSLIQEFEIDDIQLDNKKCRQKNKENQNENVQYVIAKYNFTGQKGYDLTFKRGEKIKLLKKTNNGWWYGENESNARGYFPFNFVN